MLCSYGCEQEALFTIGKVQKPCCSNNVSKCPAIKQRLSDRQKGENNSFYGKTHSEETKQQFSESRIGENNSFYGKTHSEETKQKMLATKAEHGVSYKGENNPMYGKTRTQAERKAISRTRVALGSSSRERNPNWKGGITKSRISEMNTTQYKDWRKAVFERDNFTCQLCGKRGGNLQAHHIKSWIKYPELRYELSNGQTLCLTCHKTTYKDWNDK